MRYGQPDGVRQLGRQPMVPQRAGKTDNAIGNGPGGFGKIMGDVLSDSLRILVETSSESNEFPAVGQALQINQWNARGLEIASAGDASILNQAEGALAMIYMTFRHLVIFCRQILNLAYDKEYLGNRN